MYAHLFYPGALDRARSERTLVSNGRADNENRCAHDQ